MRNHSFAPGEWYHCYNRGVEKRVTFYDSADYQRFQSLLYTSNATLPPDNSRLRRAPLSVLIEEESRKGERIVAVGAYALMPNHFHIVLKELDGVGIPRFMQKVLTGYTMYFNKRYERTGPLFSGVFKSRPVLTDRYFQHLMSYVHLNPASVIDQRWKLRGKLSTEHIQNGLESYPHSSLYDFLSQDSRSEKEILSPEILSAYEFPGLKSMLKDARTYYASAPEELEY